MKTWGQGFIISIAPMETDGCEEYKILTGNTLKMNGLITLSKILFEQKYNPMDG